MYHFLAIFSRDAVKNNTLFSSMLDIFIRRNPKLLTMHVFLVFFFFILIFYSTYKLLVG